MKPSIYCIKTQSAGKLYIMPKPSGPWLSDDIRYLSLQGVTNIVCLLTNDELDELELRNEGAYCMQEKILFTHKPIADRNTLPLANLKILSQLLHGRLNDGHNVAIHCRAGIGRAGMIACCVLQEFGVSAEAALEKVSIARGVQVPDTEEQKKFILEYIIQ